MSDPELARIMEEKMRRMMREASAPPEPIVAELDASSFGAAVSGNTPIIVDFWAEWCGPCRSMHDIVEAVAAELAGRVRFARLNVDSAAPVAQQYGVSSIPTFILFAQGRELSRTTGAVGAGGLRALAARAP